MLLSVQSVLICKRNFSHIQDRVLLQTSPSQAYNEEKTLAHARLYDAEFKRVGIPRSRYCIKIPAVGPALNAAKMLSEDRDDEEGLPIATLGTAVFGLAQAIACSQANMLYISPYFNGEFHASQIPRGSLEVETEYLQRP